MSETMGAGFNSDQYLDTLDSVLSLGPAVAIVRGLDPGWPVRFVTPNIEQFGYAPADLIVGNVCWPDLLPDDDRLRIANEFAAAVDAGAAHSRQRYRLKCADGAIRWLDDYTTFLRDKAGRAHAAQGVLVDVTEQVVAEQRLRDFFDASPNPQFQILPTGELGLMNQAAKSVFAEIEDLDTGVRAHFDSLIVDWLKSNERHEGYCTIADRVYWAVVQRDSSDAEVTVHLNNLTQQRQQQVFLEQLASTFLGAIAVYSTTERGAESLEVISAGKLASLWTGDKNTAAQRFWTTVSSGDLTDLRAALDRSASELSPLLHRWRDVSQETTRWLQAQGQPLRHTDGCTTWTLLIEDVTEQVVTQSALEGALSQTIQVLSDAVEMRDAYTAGHQSRVAVIAKSIATEMGLDPHVIYGIGLAAAVHDVGKIRVPTEILTKPDRLTSLEYDLIKGHSDYGVDLLSSINSVWPIADIVRQHHERLDGSGYPCGLQGDQILLEAKVIGVADVVEAISSARPYRVARGMDAAKQELIRGRSTIYEPQVVDAALALIERGDLEATEAEATHVNSVATGGWLKDSGK